MSDIYGLLGLSKDILQNFSLQSRDITKNSECEKILNRNTRRLKEIEIRMQSDGNQPEFDKRSVNAVIQKVKKSANISCDDWTVKELRIVAYNLSCFQCDMRIFSYAVKLLKTNWRDLFINGLVFYLMNSWNTCPRRAKPEVYALLSHNLQKYDGVIKRYILLKNHIDLLDESGPLRLATFLRQKNKTIYKAPEILGYKPSAIALPYFSDVIIEYFKNQPVHEFGEIEEVFTKHYLDRTKKLIYSFLVEEADNKSDSRLQDIVSRSARRVLGDIHLSTTWAPFSGATESEKLLLKKAQENIIAWGARQTVEAFFNICVQDPRRKKFWLDYVSNVRDFRIVGSTLVRTKLKSNSSIEPLLAQRFIETNSRVLSTAALVLFIGDKVFVEFSDVGSLYVYNQTNTLIKSIKSRRYIDSINDLKNTTLGNLIEQDWTGYLLYEEGRMSHTINWEKRLAVWLNNKMQLNPIVKKLSRKSTQTTTKESDEKNTQTPLQKINYISTSRNNINFRVNSVLGLDDIHSEWIFNNRYRIVVNSNKIYLFTYEKGCIYITDAPNDIVKVCSIRLVKLTQFKYYIHLKYYIKSTSAQKDIQQTKLVGMIEKENSNFIFRDTAGQITQVNV